MVHHHLDTSPEPQAKMSRQGFVILLNLLSWFVVAPSTQLHRTESGNRYHSRSSLILFPKEIHIFFLLRCNSRHKFTLQSVQIQWLLVDLQTCASLTTVNSRTFSSSHLTKSTPSPFSPSLRLPTPNLLSTSMYLPVLDISHEWNYGVCGLLWSAPVIYHNVFEAHHVVANPGTLFLFMG